MNWAQNNLSCFVLLMFHFCYYNIIDIHAQVLPKKIKRMRFSRIRHIRGDLILFCSNHPTVTSTFFPLKTTPYL